MSKVSTIEEAKSLADKLTADGQRTEALRLATHPGVVSFVGGLPVYQLAVLSLIRFRHQEMGGFSYGQNPLKARDLMCEIQLVADKLMSKFKIRSFARSP